MQPVQQASSCYLFPKRSYHLHKTPATAIPVAPMCVDTSLIIIHLGQFDRQLNVTHRFLRRNSSRNLLFADLILDPLLQPLVKQGYFSGGAGYVLSKEAMRRFGERQEGLCSSDHGAEDVEVGRCMQNLGVRTKESLDSEGEF